MAQGEPSALIRARLTVHGAAAALEMAMIASAAAMLATIDGAADAVVEATGMNLGSAKKALLEEIAETSILQEAVNIYSELRRKGDDGPEGTIGFPGPNGHGPNGSGH